MKYIYLYINHDTGTTEAFSSKKKILAWLEQFESLTKTYTGNNWHTTHNQKDHEIRIEKLRIK